MNLHWNWINMFDLVIVVLLLLPNLVYALRQRGEKNLCESRLMNGLEQIGRYGTMFFMIVCIEEEKFGFSSMADFVCYAFGSLVLLLAYWIVWIVYFRTVGVHIFVRKKGPVAVFVAGRRNVAHAVALKWALAVLPCALFLLCGITLKYMPLILSAVIFATGHIYVTRRNIILNSYGADGGEQSTM